LIIFHTSVFTVDYIESTHTAHVAHSELANVKHES